MPVDPHTWQLEDFVTANILNGDLNSYQAQAFSPTGVRFHSRRPLYRSTQTGSGITIAAGTWRGIYQSHGSNVIVDTSGDYGELMDPTFSGGIEDAIAFSNGNPNAPQGGSGNPIGGGGGYYLVSAFMPFSNAQNSAPYRANIADGFNANTPNFMSTGTAQTGNSSHDICCHVVDLIDFDGGTYTPVLFNGGSGTITLGVTPDGSGESANWQALWASVVPQYGFTASALPAPLTSWTGQNITSAGLNGNTGIRDILRFLNMPPALRVAGGTSTNLTSGTVTTINLGNPQIDSYGGWSNGTNTYTVPMDGVYFCYGSMSVQSSGSGNVPARVGITVNGGTPIWGPYYSMITGFNSAVSKMQILDLHAGDTVQLSGVQQNSATLGTATNFPPVLMMLWMGSRSAPSPFPTVPDLSYRYPAGATPAASLAALNSHLANDLNFLVNKPFLLSRQNTSQAIAQSTDTALLMDTITGQVHGTAGDPWSGWDATNKRYVAPVSGWYMACQEVFFPVPTLTTSPSTLAEFQVSTNGNAATAWDWYQHANLLSSFNAGGAAALGFYYLRAGDWITPGCQTQSSASGSLSTWTGGPKSHFECVWISE